MSYRPSTSTSTSTSPPLPLTNGRHHHHPHPRHVTPSTSRNPPLDPIDAEAKATIEQVKTTYKKRGHFDSLRKDVYQHFIDSETKIRFISDLEKIADAEIARDPSLLARDKGKAAELIEATVVRGDIYKDVERVVDEMLSQRTAEIEEMLTEIMEKQGMVFPVAGGGAGGGGEGGEGGGEEGRGDVDANDGDDEGDDREGREKDKDGDSDMAMALQVENRHVELPAPALVPLVQEPRRAEDVIVVPAPLKRASRFDDTIGLHLINRPPTANDQNAQDGIS